VYTSRKFALKRSYKINIDLKLKSARLSNGVLMKPIVYIEYKIQIKDLLSLTLMLILRSFLNYMYKVECS
jgi:hypothetical protein